MRGGAIDKFGHSIFGQRGEEDAVKFLVLHTPSDEIRVGRLDVGRKHHCDGGSDGSAVEKVHEIEAFGNGNNVASPHKIIGRGELDWNHMDHVVIGIGSVEEDVITVDRRRGQVRGRRRKP